MKNLKLQSNYSTAIIKAPSGRFIVVGAVPATCCKENGSQIAYNTEAEALAAILADPWIIANPEQLVQRADCSKIIR